MPKPNNTMRALIPIAMLMLTSSIIAQDAPKPERLIRLEQGYAAAVERATAPLTKTYLTELEKLKVELTKQGDLNGALAVQASLSMVSVSKPVVSTATAASNSPVATPSVGATKATKKNPFIGYWVGIDGQGRKCAYEIWENGGSSMQMWNGTTKRTHNAGHLNGYAWTRDGNTLSNVSPKGGKQQWTLNEDGSATIIWNDGPPVVHRKGESKDLAP